MTATEPPAEVTSGGRRGLKPPWVEPRFLRAWASVEVAVACLLLVVIFLSVLWQVVGRYWPAVSWLGVIELGNYSLVLLAFVMLGYLIGRNGHISIKIIDYVAKGRAFVVVKAVSAAAVAAICIMLANEAYGLILTYQTRRTSALEIPYWILYTVPMAGLISGALRAVVNILTAQREEPSFDPSGEG